MLSIPSQDLVLYAVIIGCEVGFWLVLLGALVTRYIARRTTLSRLLLGALPMIDLALLGLTALDLRSGAVASFAHGLAAAYVGFTVAFGRIAVNWADAHFAYRFVGGPPPTKAPTRGWQAVRYELILWACCVTACVITVALVEALRLLAGESQTTALLAWHKHAFGCVVFSFIFGPLWALAIAWRGPD